MMDTVNYRKTALDLLRQEASAARPYRLRVTSESMLPLLRPGDELVVQPGLPPDLRRGDLVVLDADPSAAPEGWLPVTHRIVGRGPGGWLTKGDHNRSLDPPLPERAILGRAIAVQRGAAQLDLRSRRWRLTAGFLGWWSRQSARAYTLGRRLPLGPAAAFAGRLLSLPYGLAAWLAAAGRRAGRR